MSRYQPPFQLNHAMMSRVADIAEWLGRWKQVNHEEPVPQLRRGNRIRTIQASLAIEQNTLSLEQVTAVLDGKVVLGLPREIQEVHNAFAAYEAMPGWNPASLSDLLTAHGLLLKGLVTDAGQLRQGGVGIYQDKQLVHMAPPANQLSRLMDGLLGWLEKTDAHPLIASSAVHYELEFIHPFSDGNGRIGRLWQTLMLSQWQPMLAFLPVETVIKQRQADYYRVLGESDRASDCSGFIVFMLDAILAALKEAVASETQVETPVKTRVKTPERLVVMLREDQSLTLADVADRLGLSVSAVERAAGKLREAGRLRYVGPKKGGHWEVME
jgi:Fic family protein